MKTIRSFLIYLWEIFEIAAIAVVSVVIIRSFVVQPFLVRGASMEPNFSNGNYLLVDELSLEIRNPKRGEVIVFRFPKDTSTFYIKRVIGLPGESVVLKGNRIFVYNKEHSEGFELKELYIRPDSITESGDSEVKYTLGDNQYFALGDNRSYSYDSRSWGAVPRDKIVGLARVRLWPINDAGIFEAPHY